MIMIPNDNDNHKTTIYTNNNNDNNNDDIFVSFAVPAVSSAVVPFLRPSDLGSRESQRCYRLSLGPEQPDENGKGCKDQFCQQN